MPPAPPGQEFDSFHFSGEVVDFQVISMEFTWHPMNAMGVLKSCSAFIAMPQANVSMARGHGSRSGVKSQWSWLCLVLMWYHGKSVGFGSNTVDIH